MKEAAVEKRASLFRGPPLSREQKLPTAAAKHPNSKSTVRRPPQVSEVIRGYSFIRFRLFPFARFVVYPIPFRKTCKVSGYPVVKRKDPTNKKRPTHTFATISAGLSEHDKEVRDSYSKLFVPQRRSGDSQISFMYIRLTGY
jgi:hypothetical protein